MEKSNEQLYEDVEKVLTLLTDLSEKFIKRFEEIEEKIEEINYFINDYKYYRGID